ncbi:MAG: hypothetical protein ACYDHC_10120 [Desulfuromonadaceae bacterium]
MTTLLMVLLLFLLAFTGMAAGVVMGRRSLRGGCGSGHQKSDCKKSECQCSAGK